MPPIACRWASVPGSVPSSVRVAGPDDAKTRSSTTIGGRPWQRSVKPPRGSRTTRSTAALVSSCTSSTGQHAPQRLDQAAIEDVVLDRRQRVGRQRLGGEDHRRARREVAGLVDVPGVQRGRPRQQHPFPLLPGQPERRQPVLERHVPALVRRPPAPAPPGRRWRTPTRPASSTARPAATGDRRTAARRSAASPRRRRRR